jgi:hypothetical protein
MDTNHKGNMNTTNSHNHNQLSTESPLHDTDCSMSNEGPATLRSPSIGKTCFGDNLIGSNKGFVAVCNNEERTSSALRNRYDISLSCPSIQCHTPSTVSNKSVGGKLCDDMVHEYADRKKSSEENTEDSNDNSHVEDDEQEGEQHDSQKLKVLDKDDVYTIV